mgnify:CR=1 FL=1
MKKILALLLICAFAVAFVACTGEKETTTTPGGNETVSTTTTTVADATTTTTTTTTESTTTTATETTTTRGAVVVTTTEDAKAELPEGVKAVIDVVLADGTMTDAAGNMSFELVKGATVSKTTVKHAGKEYTVDALNITAAGQASIGTLNESKTIASAQEFYNRDFSFEAFYIIGNRNETIAAICATENTSGKRGGAGIADAKGNPYFCIGLGGSYATCYANTNTTAGELVHVIGVYDKTAKQLRIYVNGQLCNSAALASEIVAIQNDKLANQLGFGADVSMNAKYDFESSSYTLVRASMYDSAVTNEQAAAIYEYAVANLAK